MSSLGGLIGNPYNAGYAATKAFDTTLAEGLWYEYRQQGVDVLGVVAGLTKTHDAIDDDTATGPAGRPMEPEDVVEQALESLGRGPTMTPGRNGFMRFLISRVLPRKRAIELMAKAYEKSFGDQIAD